MNLWTWFAWSKRKEPPRSRSFVTTVGHHIRQALAFYTILSISAASNQNASARFPLCFPDTNKTHRSVLELNVRACCLRLLNCYPFTSYSSADTIFSDATVLFSNWLWAKYRYRCPFLFFKQTSSIYYRRKTNRTSLTCDRPAIVGQLDFISSYSAAFAWWQSLQVSKFHIIFTANSTSHGCCTILKMHFNYAIYYSFSASRQWFTLVP